ncbi:MAG: 5-oxoprolinase subunit PxpB [Vicinamibacterales bacterium]
MPGPTIQALGDAAIVVTFGAEMSEAVNDRVMALAASLAAAPLSPHVRDIVPAIASLVVHVDPRHARVEELMAKLRERTKFYPVDFPRLTEPGKINRVEFREVRVHDIPVRYGGEFGPDLADVAAFAGIDAAEVVRRHIAAAYRVYMLGFLPGFAYLGKVEPSIAAPRRSTPRQQVPAGSIGIAGPQTGIYPQESPGGWQLIGRTACRMFDASSGRSLLQPGDGVRFVLESSL